MMKTMKTKLLAMLMAVTMVFAMAPLTAGIAFADDENVDPARVEVTETDLQEPAFDQTFDQDQFEIDVPEDVPQAAQTIEPRTKAMPGGCVLFVGSKKITKTSAKGKGWTFTYKNGTGTLTLNKATIKGSCLFNEEENYRAGIFALGMKLKIVLKGKNRIQNYGERYLTILTDRNLTISGKGTLYAKGGGIISEGGSITISNATINSQVINNLDYGLYADKKITIKKAKVTAKGNTNGAIRASECSISGSKISASCNSGEGIYCYNSIVISNSKVTAKVDYGYGINTSEGDLVVKDSDVTGISVIEASGVAINGTLQLVKTSKGKYITRLEGSCSEDAAYAYAVYAMRYDDGNKFRVVTPEGGYIEQKDPDFYDVFDKDGNLAKHVVIAPKKANTLSIKGKTATVKYSLLKTADQTLPIGKLIKFVKAGKGELTYAKTKGSSKILVDEATGDVTVMTGLKKGTYKVKIKVTAAGNATYLAKSRTVTATVIVK